MTLQHILEQLPLASTAEGGLSAAQRYRLLIRGAVALGSLGEDGRPALDDLCQSIHRDVRLAAINTAFAVGGATERERLIVMALADPDPVVAAKGRALAEASR